MVSLIKLYRLSQQHSLKYVQLDFIKKFSFGNNFFHFFATVSYCVILIIVKNENMELKNISLMFNGHCILNTK